VEYGIFVCGIGGQGIQLVAKMVALAASNEDRFVMLNGAYGGEMRGGKSMATIHIGDTPLHALPVAAHAGAAVVLHHRFWDDPSSRMDPDALLVVDEETAATVSSAPGQTMISIPASEIASEIGSPLVTGMALISAFNTITGAVQHESLLDAMRKLVPAHRAQHLERNARAIDAGREAAGDLRHLFELRPAGIPA
jgi:2-oxoglutarate ferredoxin oxidoreductase subunit gamma